MASFVQSCEKLHQRRSQEVVSDRGARWYKAVAHHLHRMFKRWRARVGVVVMHRLLQAWHLRSILSKWYKKVQMLKGANVILSRALQLWNHSRERAAFLTWIARTSRSSALQVLDDALRRSMLRAALQYWRQRNIMMRWRMFAGRRSFYAWYDWFHDRTAKRRLLQQCLQAVRIRTSRAAFEKWHAQYLLLQAEHDKHKQWWGTSLHRMFRRRDLRRSFRTWLERNKYLTMFAYTMNAMVNVYANIVQRSAWALWRRYIFKWDRKRRKACGCAKALAKSRRGLGWCYQCSSLTHLQNRIEDSVELVEGMAFRLAKTALSTQDANVNRKSSRRERRGRRGDRRGHSSSGKSRAQENKQHVGEVALENLMNLLKIDRNESTCSSDFMSLRKIGEMGDDDDEFKNDHMDVMVASHDVIVTRGRSTNMDNNKSTPVDLEATVGLKPLNWLDGDGNVERRFVSRSARDSFDRLHRSSAERTVVKARKKSGTTLPVEQDGLEGRSNRW